MHNILRILFLSLLMMLFACGGEESANLDPQVIRVVDDEFSPKVIRVEPGTTVIWESGGANDHNVIASDGSATRRAQVQAWPIVRAHAC